MSLQEAQDRYASAALDVRRALHELAEAERQLKEEEGK